MILSGPKMNGQVGVLLEVNERGEERKVKGGKEEGVCNKEEPTKKGIERRKKEEKARKKEGLFKTDMASRVAW